MKSVKKELNDLVGYNNLKIYQSKDYFCFSLDSILLPNFCKLTSVNKIMDLGCGNAPIPLILSTMTKAEIIGIELQKEIYDLGVDSVKYNNKENQITLYNMNIKDVNKNFKSDSFDLIVSNPPYFKVNNDSLLNDNDIKSIARHEIEVTLNDIVKQANIMLKNGGALDLIHRTDRLIEIINTFKNYNIEIKRLRFIYPKITKESNMVMIEGIKNGKPGVKVLKPLIVHKTNGEYTKEILENFSGGKK